MCVEELGGILHLLHAPDGYATKEMITGTRLECAANERELMEGRDMIAGLVDDRFEYVYREDWLIWHRVLDSWV